MGFVAALVIAGASASSGSIGTIAETRVAAGQHDAVVARTVGGMIAYSRWPDDPRPVLQLCVTGHTRHGGALDRAGATAGRAVATRPVPASGNPVGCDVLYFGAMDTASRQRLMRAIRDRPVLSIAESDADCRGGTVFCLQILPDRVRFRLSIDAVSRSGVRIDPRVLRVAVPDAGGS